MKNISPERLILLAALILLVAVAAGLGYSFPSVSDITGVQSVTPVNHSPPRLNAAALQAQLQPLTQPTTWNSSASQHPLFTSRGYLFYPGLYPDQKYLQADDGTARTPGGVLISWYRKYKIDFTNPNVDRDDPDKDGFSNQIEFLNGATMPISEVDGSQSSDPIDPLSHPAYLSRLRLQDYDRRAFHIQFRGYQPVNGVMEYQIYLAEVPSESQPGLKKTGEPLGYEGYTVGEFHQKIVPKLQESTGIVVNTDESTLELDKPEIHFKIVLTYRQEVDSPESTANFVMLMPSEIGKMIKVPRGGTFKAPFIDNSFLLIEVRDDGATVRDLKSNQEINVPHLDPAEWNLVPIPAPVTSSVKS